MTKSLQISISELQTTTFHIIRDTILPILPQTLCIMGNKSRLTHG